MTSQARKGQVALSSGGICPSVPRAREFGVERSASIIHFRDPRHMSSDPLTHLRLPTIRCAIFRASSCHGTSPSSWTATDAGPSAAIMPRIEGHRRGVASVRRTVEECTRLAVEQLTLYCLSSENWKRPAHELDFLMHLLEQYMIEERSTIMEQNISVEIIGRRTGIPERVLEEMDRTIAMSAANTGTAPVSGHQLRRPCRSRGCGPRYRPQGAAGRIGAG